MSDEANDIFGENPAGASGDGPGGADGTLPGLGEGDDAATALPTQVAGVDVSVFGGSLREVISTLDPEVQEIVAREMRGQYDDIRKDAQSKWQAASEMKKQAQERLADAEFGSSIRGNPELMGRVMALNGSQQQSEEATPLGEIDFGTPEGEQQFMDRVRQGMGLDKLRAEIREELMGDFQQQPLIKSQTLRATAQRTLQQLRSSGRNISAEQWGQVTQAWTDAQESNGLNPLDASPQRLSTELHALANMLTLGTGATNETHRTRLTSAPSPSGSSSASMQMQHPWEKGDGRRMTDDEVLRNAGGTSLEDLERALDKHRTG